MDEFELIGRYFSHVGAKRADVELGVGDDAALLRVPEGSELVAAVDTLVEGRHFPAGANPRSIGHRALAVNLSDIAAMGAVPAWATLALTVPNADAGWLDRFAHGFGELALAHGVALVGGDTTAGPLTISVQILGHVPRASALRRGGGKAGDMLAVTGTLGDSGAGLALALGTLKGVDPAAAHELEARFEYPTPRVQFGVEARGIASAAMDISDGLVGDLAKMTAASGVGAAVEVERLPISRALQAAVDPEQARAWALGAGDDYELLLAVPPGLFRELEARAARLNLRLTAIGELRRGNAPVWALHGAEYTPPVCGFDHFR